VSDSVLLLDLDRTLADLQSHTDPGRGAGCAGPAQAAARAGVPFVGVPVRPGVFGPEVRTEATFADAVAVALAP
jgi:hypothetical protein